MAAKRKGTNAKVLDGITRPEQLANVLGISGKVVRGYLRQTFARPAEAKNTSWSLTPKQVAQTFEHFTARQSPDSAE